MPNRPTSKNLVNWFASALLLTPLLFLSVRYLDAPLAYFVKNRLFSKAHLSRLGSSIPDLLLLIVLLATFTALLIYRVRSRRGLHDALTSLAKLVAWAAPASYLMKSLLKFTFGRVNTRTWLQNPDLYGFHWFERRHGFEGFPSGHMLVIVTLLAAFWRYDPRLRPWCLLLSLLLAVALIVTDYHFLSDVLAGAYLGVAVEAAVFWLLMNGPQRPGKAAF